MDIKKRNNRLRSWIKGHPLINCAELCRLCEFDRGNFTRFMHSVRSRDLTEEQLLKFEKELSEYGYRK